MAEPCARAVVGGGLTEHQLLQFMGRENNAELGVRSCGGPCGWEQQHLDLGAAAREAGSSIRLQRNDFVVTAKVGV